MDQEKFIEQLKKIIPDVPEQFHNTLEKTLSNIAIKSDETRNDSPNESNT